MVDLTGKRFTAWLVIESAPKRGRRTYWRCRCDCGIEKEVLAQNLISGTSSGCGCANGSGPHSSPRPIVIGQTYGRLRVVAATDSRAKHGDKQWVCECMCGTFITHTTGLLNSGRVISCGCYNREVCRNPDPVAAQRKQAFIHFMNACVRKRKLACTLSEDEWLTLVSQSCHYCGSNGSNEAKRRPDAHYGKSFHYNGIDRIDSSFGYVAGNCLPCCKRCNIAKNIMGYDEFKTWVHRIANHWLAKPLDGCY